MQRREAEVARFGEADRGVHGVGVADFADQDHVRRLAHRVLQRLVVAVGVEAHFALVDDGFLVPVQEFDRISTVRMWPAELVLRWSIIEASVVDLPEPVAPTTRISPRGSMIS